MLNTYSPEEKLGFAQRLQARVEAKGWSAAELGRRANLTRKSCSDYLRGLFVPAGDALRRLAAALETTPDELLAGLPELGSPEHQAERARTTQAFAEALKRRMLEQGLSPKTLARRSGTGSQTIELYLLGHRIPRDEHLRKLAEALMVQPQELLAGWAEPQVVAPVTPRAPLLPLLAVAAEAPQLPQAPLAHVPQAQDARPAPTPAAPSPLRMEILSTDPALARLSGDIVVSVAAAAEILAVIAREASRDAANPQVVQAAAPEAPHLRAVS